MIKAKINDEIIELTPEQLQMPDGWGIVTPDKVPKGYFTQEALDSKIADITKTKVDKAKQELMADAEFKKNVLSEFNISLDESGKPKGLKPDFDPDQWKQEQAKRLTEPLQNQLAQTQEQLGKFKNGMVKAEILKAANGLLKKEYLQSFTGSDDPFVVKQFGEMFDVDETGTVAAKDPDGTWAIDGNAGRMTPERFFEVHRDKFTHLYEDKRQRGSGANPGGGGQTFTEEQVAKMSDDEYAQHREAILKSAGQ